MPQDKKLNFEEGERILCFHGPLIYEAKILKAEFRTKESEEKQEGEEREGPHYFVHYRGWKNSWDEWVHEERVLKWNDENLAKQQQLKELHTRKKSAPKRETTSDAGSDRGRKRTRDQTTEDENVKRPEIQVAIPESLKIQLVDDWENVTKNQQLVPLPREPCVNKILDLFADSKKGNTSGQPDGILGEVIDGIRLYFNKALGNLLLYRFERNQYGDIRKSSPDKEPADVYGAEHLLRLFVQLPQLIAQTSMDQESVDVLREYLIEFMKFMQKNQKEFFVSEYEAASSSYINLSKST
ncbi:uncharacterized protein VTP21DRAFT_9202 [Calcarisporiella thermophila]|uniref:uncharacterized protein n=1 Tax=Calcarisporiella thermophila TaxID=911321 RepID=UPI003742A593